MARILFMDEDEKELSKVLIKPNVSDDGFSVSLKGKQEWPPKIVKIGKVKDETDME